MRHTLVCEFSGEWVRGFDKILWITLHDEFYDSVLWYCFMNRVAFWNALKCQDVGHDRQWISSECSLCGWSCAENGHMGSCLRHTFGAPLYAPFVQEKPAATRDSDLLLHSHSAIVFPKPGYISKHRSWTCKHLYFKWMTASGSRTTGKIM